MYKINIFRIPIILYRLSYIIYISIRYKFYILFKKEFSSYKKKIILDKGFAKLGPLFIKLAQFLSIRSDIFHKNIINNLEKMQFSINNISYKNIIKIIESEIKKNIFCVFSDFNNQPIGSASVAQVHQATFKDTKLKVVIKIIKPNIKNIIENDITILILVVRILILVFPLLRKIKLLDIIKEFKILLFNEIDLLKEASNASYLKASLKNSDLYIPKIYWQYSTKNILVMEEVYGERISKIKNYILNKYYLKTIAQKGTKILFYQILNGFFHADVHPGNILFNIKKNQYVAIDFGIMGSIDNNDKKYILEMLIALINRNYKEIININIKFDFIKYSINKIEFESEIRKICEPNFYTVIKYFSFKSFLLSFMQLISKFNINIPIRFFLLQKTLINIEIIGKSIYPHMNIWKVIEPLLQKEIKKNSNVLCIIKNINVRHILYDLQHIKKTYYLFTNMIEKNQKKKNNFFILNILIFILCIIIVINNNFNIQYIIKKIYLLI